MKRALRVGLLTPLYEEGEPSRSGIAKHYRHLADALVAEGHSVTVVHVPEFYAPQSAAGNRMSGDGVKIVCRPVRLPPLLSRAFAGRTFQQKLLHNLLSIRAANRALSPLAGSLDVIEATSFGALGVGCYALRAAPPVFTRVSTTTDQISAAFQTFQSRAQSLVNLLERRAILGASHLLTHTREHARALASVLPRPATAFALVPHGIPDLVSPSAPAPEPWSAGPTLLFAGQFTARKAIDVVAAAAPAFLRACPGARLAIAGGPWGPGPATAEIEQLRTEFGPRVHPIPDPDDETLQAWIGACDLFTAPSRYESFGLIYLEAMRASRAVVATRVGGIPEVVEDEVTGLLVPPGDAEALAAAWIGLARDPARAAAFGAAGRRRFLGNFTAAEMARRSTALYSNVIDFNRPRIDAAWPSKGAAR